MSSSLILEERKGFIWAILPDVLTMENHTEVEKLIINKLNLKDYKLVLDLSNTLEIYSSGIGLMLSLRRLLQEHGGSIFLVNVSDKIMSLLKSINLDEVFPMYATDVEFEMSHDDIWIKEFREKDIGFIFVAKVENGIYQISISGHMDAFHDLSAISEWKPEENINSYVMNLKNLDAMDTYGSQVFLDLIQKLVRNNGKCVTYGANEMITELLKILTIDHIVDNYDTEEEALKSIRL